MWCRWWSAKASGSPRRDWRLAPRARCCSAALLSTMLFGIGPTDSVTYAFVSLVLLVVAALACLIPALRAASVDPMRALRATKRLIVSGGCRWLPTPLSHGRYAQHSDQRCSRTQQRSAAQPRQRPASLPACHGADRWPDHRPSPVDIDSAVVAGSTSGVLFPTGRANAMMAPARSKSVGSGPIAGFMMETRDSTCW